MRPNRRIAAGLTLAANPRATGDPGWQLSFAAVVGIMLLAPPIRTVLAGREPAEIPIPQRSEGTDARVGSPGEHHVGSPAREQARGLADRVRARNTTGRNRVRGPLGIQMDRGMRRGEIRDVTEQPQRE